MFFIYWLTAISAVYFNANITTLGQIVHNKLHGKLCAIFFGTPCNKNAQSRLNMHIVEHSDINPKKLYYYELVVRIVKFIHHLAKL